jgi:hypothetical protein
MGGKNADPGRKKSRSGINLPRLFFREQGKNFSLMRAGSGIRNLFGPGSGISLTLDPECKNSDPGYTSRIPQQWFTDQRQRYFFTKADILIRSVSDPYSFFTDPDPDPVDPDGGQYGSGYATWN